MEQLADKTCVITGASSGLGRESARALAATGAHVVLTGRDRESLADAQAWIRGAGCRSRELTAGGGR